MTEAEFQQLKRDVEELKKWRKDRERQQVTYPLDTQSQQILGKYFLSQVGVLFFDAGAGGNPFRTILVQQGIGSPISEIGTSTTLIPFSVSISANTLKLGNDLTNLQQGSFADGTSVVVRSTGTLPAPLDSTVTYTVANGSSGGTVIQLDDGGGVVDITTTGSGQHFIYAF